MRRLWMVPMALAALCVAPDNGAVAGGKWWKRHVGSHCGGCFAPAMVGCQGPSVSCAGPYSFGCSAPGCYAPAYVVSGCASPMGFGCSAPVGYGCSAPAWGCAGGYPTVGLGGTCGGFGAAPACHGCAVPFGFGCSAPMSYGCSSPMSYGCSTPSMDFGCSSPLMGCATPAYAAPPMTHYDHAFESVPPAPWGAAPMHPAMTGYGPAVSSYYAPVPAMSAPIPGIPAVSGADVIW